MRDLSRSDLSDPENVRQATHELTRCSTDAEYASWARTWGHAALVRCAAAVTPRGEPDVTPIEERLL